MSNVDEKKKEGKDIVPLLVVIASVMSILTVICSFAVLDSTMKVRYNVEDMKGVYNYCDAVIESKDMQINNALVELEVYKGQSEQQQLIINAQTQKLNFQDDLLATLISVREAEEEALKEVSELRECVSLNSPEECLPSP